MTNEFHELHELRPEDEDPFAYRTIADWAARLHEYSELLYQQGIDDRLTDELFRIAQPYRSVLYARIEADREFADGLFSFLMTEGRVSDLSLASEVLQKYHIILAKQNPPQSEQALRAEGQKWLQLKYSLLVGVSDGAQDDMRGLTEAMQEVILNHPEATEFYEMIKEIYEQPLPGDEL